MPARSEPLWVAALKRAGHAASQAAIAVIGVDQFNLIQEVPWEAVASAAAFAAVVSLIKTFSIGAPETPYDGVVDVAVTRPEEDPPPVGATDTRPSEAADPPPIEPDLVSEDMSPEMIEAILDGTFSLDDDTMVTFSFARRLAEASAEKAATEAYRQIDVGGTP